MFRSSIAAAIAAVVFTVATIATTKGAGTGKPVDVDNQPTRRAAVLLVVEFVPPHNWDMAQYKGIYSDASDCLIEAEKLNHSTELFVEPAVGPRRVAMCFISYLPQ